MHFMSMSHVDRPVLAYEISSKMSADIHTKGFKNPVMWKRACMLINLLDPEDLSSKELWEICQPTTDVDATKRQAFQTKTGEVPNFQYTSTPILPPEVPIFVAIRIRSTIGHDLRCHMELLVVYMGFDQR